MKISREQTEHSIQYLRETPPPDAPLSVVKEVSDHEVQSVLSGWDGNDDFRNAMVVEIQRELSTEEYEVPSDWVAEKIVGRIVSDRIR